MKLKARLAAEKAGIDLPVTAAHFAWLSIPEREQVYSEKALAHAAAVLRRELKQPRTERISASALGERCTRRVIFGYDGAPQVPEHPRNIDLMDLGSWLHLKWQMEGLTVGWLTSAEEFFHSADLRLGGSTDGVMEVVSDGLLTPELFELKTVGGHVYDRVMKAREPKHEHALQCEGYFELSGMTKASIVYVDRETGEFHEFRYSTQPSMRAELHAILADLHDWLELDTLPDMLDECKTLTGNTYRRCPYREFCPTARGRVRRLTA